MTHSYTPFQYFSLPCALTVTHLPLLNQALLLPSLIIPSHQIILCFIPKPFIYAILQATYLYLLYQALLLFFLNPFLIWLFETPSQTIFSIVISYTHFFNLSHQIILDSFPLSVPYQPFLQPFLIPNLFLIRLFQTPPQTIFSIVLSYTPSIIPSSSGSPLNPSSYPYPLSLSYSPSLSLILSSSHSSKLLPKPFALLHPLRGSQYTVSPPNP